jgi:hypothetical protein
MTPQDTWSSTFRYRDLTLRHEITPALNFAYFVIAKADLPLWEYDDAAFEEFQSRFGRTEAQPDLSSGGLTNWVKILTRERLSTAAEAISCCPADVSDFGADFERDWPHIFRELSKQVAAVLDAIDQEELLQQNEQILKQNYARGELYFCYNFLRSRATLTHGDYMSVPIGYLDTKDDFEDFIRHEARHLLMAQMHFFEDEEVVRLVDLLIRSFPNWQTCCGSPELDVEEFISWILDGVQSYGWNVPFEKVGPEIIQCACTGQDQLIAETLWRNIPVLREKGFPVYVKESLCMLLDGISAVRP